MMMVMMNPIVLTHRIKGDFITHIMRLQYANVVAASIHYSSLSVFGMLLGDFDLTLYVAHPVVTIWFILYMFIVVIVMVS